ncbi:conserved hypothetical protein [Klebsiella quasipneumoniae subsp. similipneumoniae]|nr:conserved exported hypothetical protein [Klebsiella quasipneumoniae subsp. similipneumoniae]SAZ00074.1 conserved hypothetical protein [Klebsiella quasipneumoniae subsp. similipneumoniae]
MSLLALRLAGLQFCAVRNPGKASAATRESLLALRLAGLQFCAVRSPGKAPAATRKTLRPSSVFI